MEQGVVGLGGGFVWSQSFEQTDDMAAAETVRRKHVKDTSRQSCPMQGHVVLVP